MKRIFFLVLMTTDDHKVLSLGFMCPVSYDIIIVRKSATMQSGVM